MVLDDDPTGTQSVTGLPVLTGWSAEDLAWAFATGAPAVYVMTNSRSLPGPEAARVNQQVVDTALGVAPADRELVFVSRSDSTLRGHFPLEPVTLADTLERAGKPVDGILVVPAFGDAGRITVAGTHYAGSARDGFVPVGDSEFARDKTFGYSASFLPDWVAEKTGGTIAAEQVARIDLADLRGDLAGVTETLLGCRERRVVVSDAVTENDLRRLALALDEAERAGKRFIYRVGPPFVRARIGQDVAAPLEPADFADLTGQRGTTPGGLVVVGSHVNLTTRQLAALEAGHRPLRLEVDVRQVMSAGRGAHLAALVDQALDGLDEGHVVIATSRELVGGTDAEDSLRIAREVSAAVVEVVQRIVGRATPRFVVAKGGITSSDVATRGLGMRRAMVIGPMLPGIVSMWAAGDGPARGIPYIVFAGNVGDEHSLAAVVEKLSARERNQS